MVNSSIRRFFLSQYAIYATLIFLGFVISILYFHSHQATRNDLIGISTFLASILGAWCLKNALAESELFTSSHSISWNIPKSVYIVAILISSFWVILSIPATTRLLGSLKAIQVYSHNEAIILSKIHQIITSPHINISTLQGGMTFLPIAFMAKVVNHFVGIDVATINFMMRVYYLTVAWLCVYFAQLITYKFSKSLFLMCLIGAFAFLDPSVFSTLLAINKPDGFQLLFIMISLFSLLLFVENKSSDLLFYSSLFAGLSFGAKLSGQLLLPIIAVVFFLYARNVIVNERNYKMSLAKYFNLVSSIIFVVVLAFCFGFFIFAPFHLVNFWHYVHAIEKFIPIYGIGNVYNQPRYHAFPNIAGWWHLIVLHGSVQKVFVVLATILIIPMALFYWRDRRNDDVEREYYYHYAILYTWFLIYFSYIINRNGGYLTDYRDLFPILFLFPSLALAPIFLLRAKDVVLLGTRFIYELIFFMILGFVLLSLRTNIKAGMTFLGYFRSKETSAFLIGQYSNKLSEQANHKISSKTKTNKALTTEGEKNFTRSIR